jgi:hypothetical protein
VGGEAHYEVAYATRTIGRSTNEVGKIQTRGLYGSNCRYVLSNDPRQYRGWTMSKTKDDRVRDCYGNDLTLIIAARTPDRALKKYIGRKRYERRYARIMLKRAGLHL